MLYKYVWTTKWLKHLWTKLNFSSNFEQIQIRSNTSCWQHRQRVCTVSSLSCVMSHWYTKVGRGEKEFSYIISVSSKSRQLQKISCRSCSYLRSFDIDNNSSFPFVNKAACYLCCEYIIFFVNTFSGFLAWIYHLLAVDFWEFTM